MLEIVPYRAEHVAAIAPNAEQALYSQFATPAVARSLEGPFSKTAMVDGKPVGCAGIVNKWFENWMAWAYLSDRAGPHMLAITRAIAKVIPNLPRGRIETATPLDYAAGRRWLEMLGFNCETPNGMAHYTPDGRVFALYSRVNLK